MPIIAGRFLEARVLVSNASERELMRYETWVKRFQPIKNHLRTHVELDGYVFLPYGAELEFVRRAPKCNVWSFIVCDEGREAIWLISDGFRLVNLMGYLVTQKPREGNKPYDVRY